jgi:uncharacterized protein YbjT (DUF2867 family)
MVASDRVVVVTGATGRQGGAVARHLLSDGWRVRALTRKPKGKPARRLAALGAEVVGADMARRATLDVAFRDAYGVFSVQNPMTAGFDGEIDQGKNVADAAKKAGVQHVVYGSAGIGRRAGVGSWDSKLIVQAHMETLGLPLTVLRPTAFMELMTDRGFFPPVAMWHLMPKLMGVERPVLWLCVDDLGAIAAKAFADPNRFIGADLHLVSDVRSNAECREIWREVIGRAPRRFPMPTWMFERFVGTDLTTMWRWLHANDIDVDGAQTRDILPTASTVQEWLSRLREMPSR